MTFGHTTLSKAQVMCRNCDFVLSQAPLSKYKTYGGEQKVVNGGTVKEGKR